MFRKRQTICVLLAGVCLAVAAMAAEDAARTIEWRDLVPPEMTREMAQKGTIQDDRIKFGMRYDLAYFPLTTTLDDHTVRMLGFALPLEFEGTAIREFLLVPYVGACIHAPPPLPNQIVHVKSNRGFVSDNLFTPVWVTGILHTGGGSDVNLDFVDGAEDVQAGYRMTAEIVEILQPGE